MERILWIVVLATIAWAIAMSIEAAKFDKSRNTGLIAAYDSPVAMIELAPSQQTFVSVLDQGERLRNVRVMQANTYMDFAFIILYCTTLVLLGTACRVERGVKITLVVTVLVTGVFDYWENFRLLRLLELAKDGELISAPLSRPVSLAKWAFLATDLLIVGYALSQGIARTKGSLVTAMSILVLLAASLTFVGLVRNNVIGLGILCLFPALLIAAWVWRP